MQGDEWDSPMNYYGCGRVIRQFLGEPDLFLGRNEILRKVPYKMTAKDVQGRVTEHKALAEGGMKFLYAKDDIVVIARFYEDEVFTAVVSVSDETKKIVIPFGSVGSAGPKGSVDVFGKKLEYNRIDERNAELVVKAHQSYFIDCTK